MTRILLLAAVALVVVYQVSGAPNHNGLLREAKRNILGRRGHQSRWDETHFYCDDALEQQREVICDPNHTHAPVQPTPTGGPLPPTVSPGHQDAFVGKNEASRFLGRGVVQGLIEECCFEGCHSEEIHEHCP
ncbi:uncharacterized protein LOC117301392 [Asterias rubens]|uniref:uncharacterized protein LOC117301392 n=1 Tax=Asterias rubens TaxID=7604 RepID=UPI0014557F51|nr:uncharacterized protein LOC117301392 [Asterias rubens]